LKWISLSVVDYHAENPAFVSILFAVAATTQLYCHLSGVFGDDSMVILIVSLLFYVPYDNDHQLSEIEVKEEEKNKLKYFIDEFAILFLFMLFI
jgi:hypothetical protein